MRTAAIDVLLTFAALSAWLACWGFMRFATALARLHWVAFVNGATGAAVTLCVWLQDGLSERAMKTLAISVILFVAGSATTHAAARAVFLRSRRTQ